MRRVLLTALAVFLCSTALAADPPLPDQPKLASSSVNPSGEPPIHLQEPFILAQAKKYFLFGTASPSEGFQCYESPDLIHWKFHGWAWHKVGLHVAQGDLHSPHVFVYQGMFCLVYSGRTPTGMSLGLAASVKPQGPYHDLHVPWLALGDGSIAGDVFVDANGKAYLTFTRAGTRNGCNVRAIHGVALNKDLSRMAGEPVKLLEASQSWELAHQTLNRCNEDSRMFKSGSKYYLTYSCNDPQSLDGAIGYATADKPLGPWAKSSENPLLRTRPEIGVHCPGHGGIFDSPDQGEWFIVYDALADPAHHPEDRVVRIDRVICQDHSKLTLKGPSQSSRPLSSSPK